MKRFALTSLLLVSTMHDVGHAAEQQPSQTAAETTATSRPALDLAALNAAAQLVRSYKAKDQFDSPPAQKSLVGRSFALELTPRQIGFKTSCGKFASWSYDAAKGELEIGAQPGIVFAGDTNPSGAFPDMKSTDELAPVAFICQRVAQGMAKASNAFGAVIDVQRFAEESLSFSTNIGLNKAYWTGHVEGREARDLARAVRIRMTGVLGEWRPGQVVVCYRERTEAKMDFPFELTSRDCMFNTTEIRFEIVDSRTQSVLYTWN